MKFTNFGKMIQIAAFGAAITFGVNGTAALADNFGVTILAPGVQDPTGITSNFETFNSTSTGDKTSLTTDFGGSGITGTYTGNFAIMTDDQYGGAGGTGNYIVANQNDGTGSYTLGLSASVNYFGFWLSALDNGNEVQFYNGNTLLFTYTPADLSAAVGGCGGATPSAYCGNPNSGQNSPQQYAYLNFYDSNGTFNKIVYTETIPNAGYESDNHAVALLNTPPGGTTVGGSPVPEPSSLIMLGTGVLGVAGSLRRKLFAR